jgi:uncharacterized repeat protein (TIGR03843 family)
VSDFDNEHEREKPKFSLPDHLEDDDPLEDDTHAPRPALPIDRALEILEGGEIETEYGVLRWSSNYAFLVAVSCDDVTLNAVYKPQKGERPLWDFPDGTLCYREMASFLTSNELGWQIVPPTVLREGPRGLGSVQLFVEHDPQVNYFSFNDDPGILRLQLQRFAVFDAVINNADRKGGHCLLDGENHLWGIDHGIAFHSAPKLRTVIWDFAGEPIPDVLLLDLDRLCMIIETGSSSFRQRLNNLLSAAEIKSFQTRVKNLLKIKKFPLPGAGPNYPWPPV